jgi:hypothetical protein|tara:strand:+ start:117 stop:551 length:435 start_codon:yes stop_codon:yes gene_type:complete
MRIEMDPRRELSNHLARRIYEGDATLGWEGDPDLLLTFHSITNKWELLRHSPVQGDPDRHVVEVSGPVGQDINDEAINLMITGLVARSTNRRGNSAEDQMEAIFKKNEVAEKHRVDAAQDATADALAKFYSAAAKTFGVAATYQ